MNMLATGNVLELFCNDLFRSMRESVLQLDDPLKRFWFNP